MTIRDPIEYALNPKELTVGNHWLTLNLKNIGPHPLVYLDVGLHAQDAYNIGILGSGRRVTSLAPDEKCTLTFQVSANYSSSLYIAIDGRQNGSSFHWESPYIHLGIGRKVAELSSVFAITEPYPQIKKRINVEAIVRSLARNNGLQLEFWADTPSGKFEKLANIKTKPHSPGEASTYWAEITLREAGMHTIYAYLYDNGQRLDRETEIVYARA